VTCTVRELLLFLVGILKGIVAWSIRPLHQAFTRSTVTDGPMMNEGPIRSLSLVLCSCSYNCNLYSFNHTLVLLHSSKLWKAREVTSCNRLFNSLFCIDQHSIRVPLNCFSVQMVTGYEYFYYDYVPYVQTLVLSFVYVSVFVY